MKHLVLATASILSLLNAGYGQGGLGQGELLPELERL